MPCEMIWKDEGIIFRHNGTVTNEEVQEMNNLMYGDPRFDKIRYQIADYTRVTENLISFKEAKVIAKIDRASSHWNRKVMLLGVVTTDPQFIPVAEAYFREFVGTMWVGKCFSTLEEAMEWVGAMDNGQLTMDS